MKNFSMYVSLIAFVCFGYLIYLQSNGLAEITSVLLCYAIAICFGLAEHFKTVEKKVIHSNAMVIGTVSAVAFNRFFDANTDELEVLRAISGLILLGSVLWIIGEWGDADPNEAIREKQIRKRIRRKFRLLRHLKSRSL